VIRPFWPCIHAPKSATSVSRSTRKSPLDEAAAALDREYLSARVDERAVEIGGRQMSALAALRVGLGRRALVVDGVSV
jgi:hypothetical protein